MKLMLPFLGLLSLASCAQSACGDADVRDYTDRAARAHDIYAIGLTGAVRQTPLPAVWPGTGVEPKRAVCSAWLLSRNPAFVAGGSQPRLVRVPQDFWVAKLESGYEVGLIPP